MSTKSEKWWVNGAFVVAAHIIALATCLFYPLQRKTLLLSYVCWQLATLGITIGYHRLWSHGAFKATWPLKIVLMLMGSMGFQGSIKWWVSRHKLHHRYTDTQDDPYSAKKGFWFSHIGWIFEKPYYPKMKLVDLSYLKQDRIVEFQHRNYILIAFLTSFIAPTAIGYLWGDALGAYLYAGFVCRVLVWHVTFCINSFAHLVGEQPYGLSTTARGTLLIALVTNGEGNHNFHHEFPSDYRNGVGLLDYDLTKWIIYLLSLVGMVFDLKRTRPEQIEKAKLLTSQLNSRTHTETPVKQQMTRSEFQNQVQLGRKLLILDGFVVDLSEFDHPGGSVISKFYGKDASFSFRNGLNIHTQTAEMLARDFRIAKLLDDFKEE